MKVKVKEFRCSLIWVSLFRQGGMLEKNVTYQHEFDNTDSSSGEWSAPWSEKNRVSFWEKYLDGKKNCAVNSTKAAHCLVPLRAKDIGKIISMNNDEINGKLFVYGEGFAYPHGVACIITLRWQANDGLLLEEVADFLIKLRYGYYQWSKRITRSNLNDISLEILNYLSGKNRGELYEHLDPYTITAIVDADNAKLTEKQNMDKNLHEFLHAISTFNKRWKTAKISKIEDALLPTKGNQKYDVLYAYRSGRSIWLPEYFHQHRSSSERKSIQYISHYQRNITLATMQAAYLALFLKRINKQMKNGRNLTAEEIDCAQIAAGAVARLYGACRKSYMSSSLPRQLQYVKDEINAVRSRIIPTGRLLG
ncbi:hypothetical protein [Candidatus Electronema sp. JM]|uniref:hypothetical protein n=1 Tax=Candidatus Electronema sp. JM TaxID=3401571 RepID=UPI003AA931AE